MSKFVTVCNGPASVQYGLPIAKFMTIPSEKSYFSTEHAHHDNENKF